MKTLILILLTLSSMAFANQTLNPVYTTILNEFNKADTQEEILSSTKDSDLTVLKGLNHVGLNYSKSFANFSVVLKRELAPDLFDDERWIVTDRLEINVDASKALGNLNDTGAINLSETELAAYAGLSFKRVYTYFHFADSYQQGLVTDLNKVFAIFKYFNGNNYTQLSPYEYLIKEDYLGIRAGAKANVSLNSLVVQAGAYYKYDRLARVDIQGLGEKDQKSADEKVRISIEKTNSKSVGASIGISFINIININLFSYELEYNYSDTYRVNLSLTNSALLDVENSQEVSSVIASAIKGDISNVGLLRPYIISEERRRKETESSRYATIFSSKKREKETEHFYITNKSGSESFFRHNFEEINYRGSLLSSIYRGLISSFLRADAIVTNSIVDRKNVRIEYSSKENLINDRSSIINIENGEEKISLSFSREYRAGKIDSRREREYAARIIGEFSGFDPRIEQAISSGQVNSNISMNINYQISKEGIKYFNNLSYNNAYKAISNICKSANKAGCHYRLQKAYDNYYQVHATRNYSRASYGYCASYVMRKYKSASKRLALMEKCMQINTDNKVKSNLDVSIWNFRIFVEAFKKFANHKQDLYDFFGINNLYLRGSISGVTNTGKRVYSNFSEGEFNGLGVINNYMKENNMRSLASIQ